jgi:hypothetical protein
LDYGRDFEKLSATQKQDLDAALKYAAELLKQEKVYPLM